MVMSYAGRRGGPCAKARSPHNLHLGATRQAEPRSGGAAELLESPFEVGHPGGQGVDVGPFPVPMRTGRAPGSDPVPAADVGS
jgi:hypothetical protein